MKTLAVVYSSDQGSQYTSIAFGLRCKAAGIRPSMDSRGDCYDNAMCESFNATLECELLARNRFRMQPEAEAAVSLHRGVVQSTPSPLRARLSLTDQLRMKSTKGGLTFKPKTVHGSVNFNFSRRATRAKLRVEKQRFTFEWSRQQCRDLQFRRSPSNLASLASSTPSKV